MMRLGIRASIFLGAAAAAMLSMAAAVTLQSTFLGLLAGIVGAIGAAGLISSTIDTRVGDLEGSLNQSIRELSARVADLTTHRARTDALLSGMVEGVLAVDASGRLQLINDAARRMLNLERIQLGRHYVEAMRHPVIAQQLSAALRGERLDPSEMPIGARVFSTQAT